MENEMIGFSMLVDGEKMDSGKETEENAIKLFYSKVHSLDCKYKVMELHMLPAGGKPYVRVTAYSDGKAS